MNFSLIIYINFIETTIYIEETDTFRTICIGMRVAVGGWLKGGGG